MHTAASLELYMKDGADRAAEEISNTIEQAIVEMKKKIGNGQSVGEIIGNVFREMVSPVMLKFREFGATDTEPYYHAAQTLINAAKESLGIDLDEYHPEFADYL
jgi:hypothetical protein